MQVPIDTWPKSADRMLEVVGSVILVTHIIALFLLVLWFGLGKPSTLAEFRTRLKAAMRGQPLPERVRGPKYETRIYMPTGPGLPPRGSMERKAMISRAEARKNGEPGR